MMLGPAVSLTLAVLLAVGGGCERRRDFIGRLPADSSVTGDDAGGPDADGPAAAACRAPAAAGLVVPPPVWTCPGQCVLEPDSVAPAVLSAAAAEADPARRPLLVYPPPGSVHPVNLPGITLQWKRAVGAGQTSFRITVAPAGAVAPYELHVGRRAPTGPTPAEETDALYAVPEPVWRWIAQENAGRDVAITVAGYDPARNTLATSAPVTIRFSLGPVEGALHFLATEPPAAGINRYLFGARSSHLLVPVTPGAGPADCKGCHSPSRDGATLGFAASYQGSLAVVRTADPSQLIIAPVAPPGEANGISPAVSPDGRMVLAREGVSDRVTVYRIADRAVLSVADPDALGGRIDYPEWSPDGREIAATRSPLGGQLREYSAAEGELVIIPIAADGRLGQPRAIVSDPGQAHSHPSWSPDGLWIVFASSPAGVATHRNPQTLLRLVRRADGAVVTLTRASGGPGHASTYPKLAPVGQNDCQLLFVVFQSRLDYGLVRRAIPLAASPQLWMSAIDLTLLASLTSTTPAPDPSSPPIWLPFQEVANNNLLPAWSAQVRCTTDANCGAGATCRAGACAVTP